MKKVETTTSTTTKDDCTTIVNVSDTLKVRKPFVTKTGASNIKGLDSMMAKIGPIVHGVVSIIDNEKESKSKMQLLEESRPRIHILEDA